MAKIVLGMAAPHSGMLGKPPETWLEDGLRDRKNPELWFGNRMWSYEQLEAHRGRQNFEPLLSVEERRARFVRCRAAIETLRQVSDDAKIDVAVIIGKDQREIFIDVTPTFAIHTGTTVENGPPQRSNYAPDAWTTYPVATDLGAHLMTQLQGDGFDIASISKSPPNTWLQNKPVVPHAYGFIYHEIMRDRAPPSVPIYMNTFYPPNQPSIGRSIDFGKALSRAIASWPSDLRVGLFASGGLSHFVCDEALDKQVIDAFKSADFETLRGIDERTYQSGTSEVKLFVPILVAMSQMNCPMTLVDYVPCYRTEAGTGEGMAFMYWNPASSSH